MKNIEHLPLRLMFQDEARFGRMSDPRSCWAPAPHRPVVNLALVREFRYEYAAVSPWDGYLDFMTAEKMNTDNMALLRLPPYSPELNPAEQIWNKLRRDYFANRVFDSLGAATTQAEQGLAEMAVNKPAISQLTNWPWISAIMKA